METELRDKLDDDSISITWDELRAADITGRARAFQSLVGAGMDLAKAAALSGLLAPGSPRPTVPNASAGLAGSE